MSFIYVTSFRASNAVGIIAGLGHTPECSSRFRMSVSPASSPHIHVTYLSTFHFRLFRPGQSYSPHNRSLARSYHFAFNPTAVQSYDTYNENLYARRA